MCKLKAALLALLLGLVTAVGLAPPARAEDHVVVVDLVRTDAYPRITLRFSISAVDGVAPSDLQPRHLVVTEGSKPVNAVDVYTVRRSPDGRVGVYEAVWSSQAVDYPGGFVPGTLTLRLAKQPEASTTFSYLKPLLTRLDPVERGPTPVPIVPEMAFRPVQRAMPPAIDVPTVSAAAGVVAGVGVLALAAAAGWRTYRRGVDERLSLWVSPVDEPRIRAAAVARTRPRRRAIFSPAIAGGIARFGARLLSPAQAERVRRNLVLAGRPTTREFNEFIAVKCLLGIVFAGLGALIMVGRAGTLNLMLVVACLGIAGFFLPNLWLGRAIKRRQYLLLKALPDALDLMTVGVTAGLAFDGAINEIVEKWDNPLSHEFGVLLGELRMGVGRREALLNLVERTDVTEIRTMVTQLIQADELGMSLADTLQTLAAQMRLRRRQQAEEQAHKAAVKMLIPLVFLVFPALFVVIIGPAVPDLLSYITGEATSK